MIQIHKLHNALITVLRSLARVECHVLHKSDREHGTCSYGKHVTSGVSIMIYEPSAYSINMISSLMEGR